MALSVKERTARASAAHVANARARRFRRYAEEMARSDIPREVFDLLAEEMRADGWVVVAPDQEHPYV